jgi:predicted nucleotidyltransferase
MSKLEDKIIEYLQKEYNAKGILLHGSRARGIPHEQSDWDLLVFTDKVTKGNSGVELDNQDLDIKIVELPILDMDKFVSDYAYSLLSVRVLFDTDDGLLKRVVGFAEKKNGKGPGITNEQKEAISNHFDRMLSRLVDFKDEPQIFFYHLSAFYFKTFRYWFEYQDRWSRPIVEAIKIIEKEDEAFMDGVKIISDGDSKPEEKISAAKKMISAVLGK